MRRDRGALCTSLVPDLWYSGSREYDAGELQSSTAGVSLITSWPLRMFDRLVGFTLDIGIRCRSVANRLYARVRHAIAECVTPVRAFGTLASDY